MSIIVKTYEDLGPIDPRIAKKIRESMNSMNDLEPYDPRTSGWFVVVQEGDDPRNLAVDFPGGMEPWDLLNVDSIGESGPPVYWPIEEAIAKEEGFFDMFITCNNEFGLSFLVPDEAWIDPELRHRLEGGLPPFPGR